MKRHSVLILAWLMSAAAMAAPQNGALSQLRRSVPNSGAPSAGVPEVGPVIDASPRVFTGLPVAPSPGGGGILQQISDAQSALYQKIAPSVVRINLSGDQNVVRAIEHKQLDDELDKRFKQQRQDDQFQAWLKAHGEKTQTVQDGALGEGTGFIIDPSGLVLTADHVVAETAEGASVTIQFVDGTQVPGKVLKRSPKLDVALLQAQLPKPAPALRAGDSNAVKIGEVVCALGNPLGLQFVFTCGSVSAINDMGIEHTAPITNGNSGGPLVNAAGEVVGINYQVLKNESGAVEPGMGFAIPINQVRAEFIH